MAINSIVVVADNTGDDTSVNDLSFTPGSRYPVEGTLRLTVQDQPFPRTDAPTRVVPAIQTVLFSYGHSSEDPTEHTAAFVPDEHWLRELTFSATYVSDSWRVAGNQATVDIRVSAGLRDNSPAGEHSPPDDPFAAHVEVRALCIWTEETMPLFDRLRELTGVVVRPKHH